jgi:hypothetical protein
MKNGISFLIEIIIVNLKKHLREIWQKIDINDVLYIYIAALGGELSRYLV